MTRINTNVSSLTAQKSLARSNVSLQQALTRLSTGLRINTGKDDPAGLVASEMLRSDMVGVQRAISNSQRANQVIAAADSALGQVSALLNDIRGLVTEAANAGAMSDDQIAANQLQINSSLDAINRIAQTTSFQGRKLLDGSLAFQTTAGTNFDDIADMEITQANLGTAGEMDVDIRVIDAATKAEVKMTGSTYTLANDLLTFGNSLAYKANNGGGTASLNLYSKDGTDYDIVWDAQDTNPADAIGLSMVDADTLKITIDTDTAGDNAKVSAIATAINADATVKVKMQAAQIGVDSKITTADNTKTAGMAQNTLNIAAVAGNEGPDFNNMEISFATSAAAGVAAVWTDLDDRSTLVITMQENAEHTLASVKAAIDIATNAVGKLTATAGTVAGASVSIYSGIAAFRPTGDTEGTGGGVLTGDLVLQLTGKTGSEFLSFQSATQMAHIASAVNAISDTLGIAASVADGTGSDTEGTLVLTSSDYGSRALIDIDVLSEGALGTFESSLTVDGSAGTRDTGTDINATVNGSATMGNGNTFSLSTAMLSLEATVAAGVEETISFTIDSGGALFQLGPDVVATQQARLGIKSINTAQLRGETGRLYELGSGRSAALATDSSRAAQIVDEVISKVTSLRGRLGAFQKTTLEPNIASLSDTLETLTDAESSIRDADFAAETAALTRAQILVQSGVSVLAIANSNPQNVLALLR